MCAVFCVTVVLTLNWIGTILLRTILTHTSKLSEDVMQHSYDVRKYRSTKANTSYFLSSAQVINDVQQTPQCFYSIHYEQTKVHCPVGRF